MQARWGSGIFLGKMQRSDECMVYTEDGTVVRCRSIRLLPDSESWDCELLENMQTTRWNAQFVKGGVPLEERENVASHTVETRSIIPRDFTIRQAQLDEHGYTPGCSRCRGLQRGIKPSVHHTRECRERFRNILQDKGGADNLATRAQQRRDEFVAQEVQAATEGGRSALFGGDGVPGSSAENQSPSVPSVPETVNVTESTPVPGSDLEDEEGNSKRVIDEPEGNAKRRKKDSKKKGRPKESDEVEERAAKKQKAQNEFEELFLGSIEESNVIWKSIWMKQNPITNKEWNIEEKSVQLRIIHLIHKHKPQCIVSKSVDTICAKWKDLKRINEFLEQLCEIQRKGDRTFVILQSLSSPRWAVDQWSRMRSLAGSRQFGVHVQDADRRPKALRVTTNSNAVAEAMLDNCGTKGVEEKVQKGCEVEKCEKLMRPLLNLSSHGSLHQKDGTDIFVDDTTGIVLDLKATNDARKLEMQTLEEMKVYEYVRKEIALKDKRGKLVGVRWVDVQKGPIVRSRLVAQEFASKEDREDIFAATPPLFATKLCISDAASCGDLGKGERALMILDVKRAFLYGDIEDDLYIELPKEDPWFGHGYVGKLKKAMYGTRGAPQVWQKLVKRVMTSLGFEMNEIHPCVFYHRERDMLVVTHVDDFLVSGNRSDLKWLHQMIEKEFEIKGEILGNRPGESRDASFLGRTIRLTPEGYEYESDPKHVKILLQEWNMENSKSLSSPGSSVEKPDATEKADEEEALDPTEAKNYRRAATRLNYMSLDRADLSFTSKEASRGMSSPTKGDVVRLKRILRYLKGATRIVNKFNWQEPQFQISGYSDSDWAGCTKTRKSTSGGFMMLGKHLIAHWSSTQSVISLSSAEAELNALVKMFSETIGLRNTMACMDKKVRITIYTDSSASKGIVQRTGCGKAKHLETRQLWIQGHVSNKDVTVTKIPREYNTSDCLTHHWSAKDGYRHLTNVGIVWRE